MTFFLLILQKIALGFLAFFLPFFSVFADESWEKDVSFSGGYALIEEENFDIVSFEIPENIELEYLLEDSWKNIHLADDEDPFSRMSNMLTWERGSPLFLRVSGHAPKNIHAFFSRLEERTLPLSSSALASTEISLEGLRIVSREGWGADESIRYNGKNSKADTEERETGKAAAKARAKACVDSKNVYPDEFEIEKVVRSEGGNTMIWPYQYSKRIQKVVIHHTAETGVKKGLTAEKVMRGIYRYHTITRKWGDIGYHYVVSPSGRIFEGRSGGTSVVGAHAYCNNIGTIGISLMGNFQEEDPTPAQIAALGKLLPRLAKKYTLDLTDTDYFHGKKTQNLLGHRDLGSTACPGGHLYSLLSQIRSLLDGSAEIALARSFKLDGEPANTLGVVQMKPGQSQSFLLAFKNTGNLTWGRSTWLFANAGEGMRVKSIASTRGYVAAKMKEQRVAPGEIAHFSVEVEAGYRGGISTISFVPVVDNKRVYNAETLQVFEVEQSDWGGKFQKIITVPNPPLTGRSTSLSVYLKNTGQTNWDPEHISLSVRALGSKEETILSLQQRTKPREEGAFLGRLPAQDQEGEVLYQMQLLLDSRKLSVHFLQEIPFLASSNSGFFHREKKKILLAKSEEDFTYSLVLENTGNVTWEQKDIRLTLINKRKRETLFPEEKTIKSGEKAHFLITLPNLKKGITPLVVIAKDGLQRLDSHVLLIRGVKRFHSSSNAVAASPEKILPQKKEKKVIKKVALKNIRIRLSFPSEKQRADIRSSSTFDILGSNLEKLEEGKYASIKQQGSLLSWKGKSYERLTLRPQLDAGILAIENWKRTPAWDTAGKWNDNSFLGSLEIRILDGKMVLINELPLEYYIAGVAETTEANAFEKKRALAIVARSYAAYYLTHEKFPEMPYNGSDNPNEFQKYLGASLSARSPQWIRAVLQTTSEVLTFEDEIIKTPFHTCSGGKTLSAKEKWGWDTPYLPAVDDPGGQGKERQGHGVGLSGCGSQYFAEEKNWNYEQILEYFYPGTKLEKMSLLP